MLSEDYLAHYGVKGMKWGVRKKKEEKQAAIKAMSDYELNKQVRRLELESKYDKLTTKQGRFKKIGNDLLNKNIDRITGGIATVVGAEFIRRVMRKKGVNSASVNAKAKKASARTTKATAAKAKKMAASAKTTVRRVKKAYRVVRHV